MGTRTIVAIRLAPGDDPIWHQGPPYIADETVFDEVELAKCHLTNDALLQARLESLKNSGHPGFPHEVVMHMADARGENHYPRKGVLRFDRRAQDGEILPRTRAESRTTPGSPGCICRSGRSDAAARVGLPSARRHPGIRRVR